MKFEQFLILNHYSMFFSQKLGLMELIYNLNIVLIDYYLLRM